MAKATSKTEVTGVTLQLDKDEAQALAAVLNYVTGTAKSPAKHTSNILTALSEFNMWTNPVFDLVKAPMYDATGIRFADYKADKNT